MPRKRSKRRDPVVQQIDFDESDSGLDATAKCNEQIQEHRTSQACPICPCKSYLSDLQEGRFQHDCNCGSCAVLNTDEFNNDLSDDFSHRDRPRVVSYRDPNPKPSGGDIRPELHWLWRSLLLLLLIVTFLGILLLLKWILVEGTGHLTVLWINFEDYTDNEPIWLAERYWLLGPASITIVAIIIGLCCACFSWDITYYDSLQPGMLPPTPLSPVKTRQHTKHNFHFGYILAIANGLAAFTLAWWWL